MADGGLVLRDGDGSRHTCNRLWARWVARCPYPLRPWTHLLDTPQQQEATK